jgi:hypothetical protein
VRTYISFYSTQYPTPYFFDHLSGHNPLAEAFTVRNSQRRFHAGASHADLAETGQFNQSVNHVRLDFFHSFGLPKEKSHQA